MGKAKKNIEENTGPEVKSFWENKVLEFYFLLHFKMFCKKSSIWHIFYFLQGDYSIHSFFRQ